MKGKVNLESRVSIILWAVVIVVALVCASVAVVFAGSNPAPPGSSLSVSGPHLNFQLQGQEEGSTVWDRGSIWGWAEGDWTPQRLEICTTELPVEIQDTVALDYWDQNAEAYGFDQTRNWSCDGCTSFTVTAQDVWTSGPTKDTLNTTFTVGMPDGTADEVCVYIYWEGHLAVSSGATKGSYYWPGCSLHVAETDGNAQDLQYCDITAQSGTLTLVKHLPNDDGGTLTEDDFPVYIDSALSSWGTHQIDAGSYVVSEDEQTGYAASDWGGDCDAQGNVTLALGDQKTCEITNDDIAPTLTLVKHLPNDDGGTLTEDDFPVYIDSALSSWGTHQLDAGSYVVSEDEQTGYAASDWGGDCDAQGNVTLAPGDQKTCEITNDDIAPTLTLVKHLPNDDGGTLTEDDFPVYIDSALSSWGTHQLDAGS
jgi:hypothetical protein